MPRINATQLRHELYQAFNRHPKVAGVLAACARAGLDSQSTRNVIQKRASADQQFAEAAADLFDRLARVKAAELPPIPRPPAAPSPQPSPQPAARPAVPAAPAGPPASLTTPVPPAQRHLDLAPPLPGRASGMGGFKSAPPPLPSYLSKSPASQVFPRPPDASKWDVAGEYGRRLWHGAQGAVNAVGSGAYYGGSRLAGMVLPESAGMSGVSEMAGTQFGRSLRDVGNAFNPRMQATDPQASQASQLYSDYAANHEGLLGQLPGAANNVATAATTLAMTPGANLVSVPGRAALGAAGTAGATGLASTPGLLAGGARAAAGQVGQAGIWTGVGMGAQRLYDPPQKPLQMTPIPDLSPETLSKLDPSVAPGQLRGEAAVQFDELMRKNGLNISNLTDGQKAIPEFREPIMKILAAQKLEGHPIDEQFQGILNGDTSMVTPKTLYSLLNAPGNEGFTQPQPQTQPQTQPQAQPQTQPQTQQPTAYAPTDNPLKNIWSFINDPNVDPMLRGAVGIGIPLAIAGLLHGALGSGGLGSLLIGALGLGAAGYGASHGGLLSGGLGSLFGGGTPEQPTAGGTRPASASSPPAPPAPELSFEQLQAMTPQQRIAAIYDPDASKAEMAARMGRLSERFEPDQLRALVSGVEPEAIEAVRSKLQTLQAARNSPYLGRFTDLYQKQLPDPALAELLQALPTK
jgi:hypothetical protein